MNVTVDALQKTVNLLSYFYMFHVSALKDIMLITDGEMDYVVAAVNS
jgi:hypothetical protein